MDATNGKAGTDAQGAVQDPAGTPDTSTAPGTNAADPKNPAGGAQPGTQNNSLDEPKFTQRQLNAFIANAKREGQDEVRRTAQEAADKAAREEAERQGNFRTLYEQEQSARSTEKETLTSLQEKIQAYETAEMARLDEALKGWPESLRKLDPGIDNVEARLKWFEAYKGVADELSGTTTPSAPGNTPNPKPAGGSGAQALLEQTKKEMQQTGRYGRV